MSEDILGILDNNHMKIIYIIHTTDLIKMQFFVIFISKVMYVFYFFFI